MYSGLQAVRIEMYARYIQEAREKRLIVYFGEKTKLQQKKKLS